MTLAEKSITFELCCLALLVLAGFSIWPVQSYFEARAYNRLTGSDVSTWDAMWIELRVEGRAGK